MIKLNEDPAKQVYLRSESEAAFFDTLRSDDQFGESLIESLTSASYFQGLL
jgi:hypothetical protein